MAIASGDVTTYEARYVGIPADANDPFAYPPDVGTIDP
jgi:hypothetical protein